MHCSVGVKYVFVNGRPVLWDAAMTEERRGVGQAALAITALPVR